MKAAEHKGQGKRNLLSDPPVATHLRPGQLDDVGLAVLALTSELWVLADRLAIIEAALTAKGLVLADEIDRFRPDAALEAKLAARRERLTTRITAALAGLPPPTPSQDKPPTPSQD